MERRYTQTTDQLLDDILAKAAGLPTSRERLLSSLGRIFVVGLLACLIWYRFGIPIAWVTFMGAYILLGLFTESPYVLVLYTGAFSVGLGDIVGWYWASVVGASLLFLFLLVDTWRK